MDQKLKNRIMIVGGDSHFSYLMQRYARTSDHQTIPANLGEDVLTLARCEKPIAIVLQVDLPGTIGWSTLRSLKADPDLNSIPIIVCSWSDQEARWLAEGADIYLHMPVLYSDFQSALTASLRGDDD